MKLFVELSKRIDSDGSATGDAFEGVLKSATAGPPLAPGLKIRGRILRLQQALSPRRQFIFAVRLDAIQKEGEWQALAVDPAQESQVTKPYTLSGGAAQLRTRTPIRPMPIEGMPNAVGFTFFTDRDRLVLEPGWTSVWITREPCMIPMR